MTTPPRPVQLIARWSMLPGCEQKAIAAFRQFVSDVLAHEPGTLLYTVHTPSTDSSPLLVSRPPSSPCSLVFYEIYESVEAFQRHLESPHMKRFLQEHGRLFLPTPGAPGQPFVLVEFLERQAGFIRDTSSRNVAASPLAAEPVNRHPAVMFEILAKNQGPLLEFYRSLFGWEYQLGTNHFAYISFPARPVPLLGGIGQADPKTPGFEAGCNFYLLVEDLKATLDKAQGCGGRTYVEPVVVDGYHFAMMKDPEDNVIGLIQPFEPGAGPRPDEAIHGQ
ncbi:MAG TPA: antibiotic biosynthesis monooxygenase [Myxococcaceae bacterium]|nr:antibiotic biosynthesis monooxygenase [Myxococcaceae bacterium]